MFQPGLKAKSAAIEVVKAANNRISVSCEVCESLACALLFIGQEKRNQWSENRKEQPCQHSQSHQLSTAIPSRFFLNGSEVVRPAPASALQALTHRSCMPPAARQPRINCRDSYKENRSTCGQPTGSTADAWSARSISATAISQTIFLNANNLLSQEYETFRLLAVGIQETGQTHDGPKRTCNM